MALTLTEFCNSSSYTKMDPIRSPSREPLIQFCFEIQACKPLPHTLWNSMCVKFRPPSEVPVLKAPHTEMQTAPWASWAEREAPTCPVKGPVRLEHGRFASKWQVNKHTENSFPVCFGLLNCRWQIVDLYFYCHYACERRLKKKKLN